MTVRIKTSRAVGKSQDELRQMLAAATGTSNTNTDITYATKNEASVVRQTWEKEWKQKALLDAEKSVVFGNFLSAIKNVETLGLYHKGLHKFMSQVGITSYEYFSTSPADRIEQDILNFTAARIAANPSITGNGIYNYTKPVRLLLNQNNRKDIDWARIGRATPAYNNSAADEAYDIDQVRLAFESARLRGKVAIGLMSGSGMRKGGLVGLCFKHLVSSPLLDRYGIYKVRGYADTKYEYHTYTTAETRRLIEQYREQRIRDGEGVTEDSPVIRDAYDPDKEERVREVVPATDAMLVHMMLRILQGCGLRVNIPSDPENGIHAGSIRHDIKLDHGFRKFFETTCTDWGLPEAYIRLLQGHKSKGLKNNYYRPKDDGYILEGNEAVRGYVQMMPYLTINNATTLAEENEKLRIKLDSVDAMIDEKVKQEVGKMMQEDVRRMINERFKPENMTF